MKVKREDRQEGDWKALDRLRTEIDGIDSKIISLLARRQDIAAAIGEIKRKMGVEIFDPARESEILRHLTSSSEGNLSKNMVRHIFNEIISAARSVQIPLSVAFLGPEGTFSHQAAISLFGRSASLCAVDTIEDVFSMVEKDICQRGLVPIENSYEGSVNNTLDLLYKYELKISAEIFLRIRHHLLSSADDINNVNLLYSHPMPVAQCRLWIKNNLPKIPIKEVNSTSLAAKKAAEDMSAAAIGSRLSALVHGVNILEENIEDSPDNITRFLAIGKADSEPTGNDKTSILFFLSHKPGALHKALGVLARKNINMSRIESRPMKTRKWEYLFFVDLEGHGQDRNVSDALREMEEHCVVLKRLGSYPAAGEPWE